MQIDIVPPPRGMETFAFEDLLDASQLSRLIGNMQCADGRDDRVGSIFSGDAGPDVTNNDMVQLRRSIPFRSHDLGIELYVVIQLVSSDDVFPV